VWKDNTVYYVRNDCVQLVNSETTGTVTTTTTTSSGSGYGYVQTIMGGCNLRSTMGGTVIKQVGKYQTYQVLSRPTTKGGYTWYYVNADGNKGYLRSDVVKVVSGGSTSTSTSSTGTSASVSTDSDATGYVKTTANAVIMAQAVMSRSGSLPFIAKKPPTNDRQTEPFSRPVIHESFLTQDSGMRGRYCKGPLPFSSGGQLPVPPTLEHTALYSVLTTRLL
jgi:hypothetical protein